MRLLSDPAFGEVDLTASAEELARLAELVAAGGGFVGASAPRDGDALTGIEVGSAGTGPGVHIGLDAPRRVLVINGDAGARMILAADLRDMADAEDGGHLHLDHFPDHPYLAEGSVPVVVNSPHGGMPIH